ncbi:MAG: glycosyltransferase [Thermodesulfobacteriota bacterium]
MSFAGPIAAACAVLSFAAWVYLVFGRSLFWLADSRLGHAPAAPERWPSVGVVIPARDEAEVIGGAVGTVLGSDYPGPLRVVLVDDESSDNTAEAARGAASAAGKDIEVVGTAPRPQGWAGKPWAMKTGVDALAAPAAPEYILFADADIVFSPRSLGRLVARAVSGGYDLTSLMVLLRAETAWERLLVPAFVYFFAKLYPPGRVSDPASKTAAAAGGCMLVSTGALERAGGIEAIKGEIIDDCALARAIKTNGPIWLGLGEEEKSVRGYGGVKGVWRMVARTAYTQLGYSPLLLAGTLAGMALLYAVPPLAVALSPLHGSPTAAWAGLGAWLLQAVSFIPFLRLYGAGPLVSFALPAAGVLYGAMTLDSALRHRQGRGAEWKGRVRGGKAGGAGGAGGAGAAGDAKGER